MCEQSWHEAAQFLAAQKHPTFLLPNATVNGQTTSSFFDKRIAHPSCFCGFAVWALKSYEKSNPIMNYSSNSFLSVASKHILNVITRLTITYHSPYLTKKALSLKGNVLRAERWEGWIWLMTSQPSLSPEVKLIHLYIMSLSALSRLYLCVSDSAE